MSSVARRLDAIDRRLDEAVTAPEPPVRAQPANIIDFATNSRFLGKRLFPAQGTVLKVLNCATELLTPWDEGVIDSWEAGFTPRLDRDTAHWEGTEGTPGDLRERMEWNRQQGRRYFGETLLLIGRRGSKGYLAGIQGAWAVWQLLTDGDPHQRHGIDPRKRLYFVVYAGTKAQAIKNVFRDIVAAIIDAPCFEPYIARRTKDRLLLYTPNQLAPGVDDPDPDLALIEILASETKDLAQRGSAIVNVFLDEFAHVTGAGSTSSSTEIYNATLPATAQFQGDAAIIQTTSPWDKQGQAWIAYNRACALDPGSGQALNPDFFVLQLPSPALYRDHDIADTIPMWPGGPTYPPGLRPFIVFDEKLLREEAANPDTFAVEYRSQWRESLTSYFPKRFIDRLWAPHRGRTLEMQTVGRLGTVYIAHADPSLSQANFGFAIYHLEDDDDAIPHLVFDVVTHWSPQDFPDGIVNYIEIGAEILDFITSFGITDLSFDHWNSAEAIQRLRAEVSARDLPRRCNIFERRPTAQMNWDAWELFKSALGHGIVHAPYYRQADLELRAVLLENGKIRPPTSGDVRTKDVADAMVFSAYTYLVDHGPALFNRLSELTPRASYGESPGQAALRRLQRQALDPDTPQARLSALTRRHGTAGRMRGAARGHYYDPSRHPYPWQRRR